MRKLTSILLIVAASVLLVGTGGLLWAQPPAIDIDLRFDKAFYGYGEPVGVEVVVSNQPQEDLWITEGFSIKVFYRQLRVVDPSGRLLLARLSGPSVKSPDAPPLPDESQVEAPDAPPFPWSLSDGRLIRTAPCELLPAGWSSEPWQERTDDLRAYYEMELPGYYSAQVQLAVMTFKGSPCNVNDYEWQGLLKSETEYFYLEGSTKVKVIPNQWKLKWKGEDKKKKKKTPDVQVQIWPEEGKTVADYNLGSIRLNNVVAKRVKALPPKIKAFFDSKEAINSLGDVERGQWYPVVISGKLISGQFFGGSRRVRIVH